VQFDFTEQTMLGPGQTLLLVGFDAEDAARATIFRFSFNVPPEVQVLGPYSDDLEDSGVTLRLLKQMNADSPVLAKDFVAFSTGSPWPDNVVETGNSLTRTSTDAYGPLPTSWVGREVTPGLVDQLMRIAGDANEDGLFDQSDIVLVLQAAKYLTGQPATWSEGDWNGDGVFDQLDLVEALR
jgi:hypothetical protein